MFGSTLSRCLTCCYMLQDEIDLHIYKTRYTNTQQYIHGLIFVRRAFLHLHKFICVVHTEINSDQALLSITQTDTI